MSSKTLKVTDKRMFTPEGELREEFRHVQERSGDEQTEPAPAESRPAAGSATEPRPSEPARRTRPAAVSTAGDEQEQPTEGQPPGSPGFFDLVGLLAEPASIYLREARNAAPQTAAQSIELARLHIELLAVLQDKTQGNLTPKEKAMLEDVVYQLRSGFVGLRG